MIFFCIVQVDGDRYYLDGLIKISKSDVDILKGMNYNYLTLSKEFDYRFISRLLGAIFSTATLTESCVKSRETNKTSGSTYKELDATKFEFIKG